VSEEQQIMIDMAFKKGLLGGAAAAALLGSVGTAHAGAFYLQEQSVRAAGRAFSGEAASTGADALWWNPAAIAGQRSEAYLGASAILPKGDVIDTGTTIRRPVPGAVATPVGGNGRVSDPINKGVVPSGAVGLRLNDSISVGLAVSAPFNFTTNYDATDFTRYTADKSRLRTIDVQPSIAVAPADWLRLGIAGNFERVTATLSNKLPNVSAALADGEQTLKGKGWDAGYSVGAQIHSEQLTIGLSYKSKITHDLDGTVTVANLVGPLAANNFSYTARASFTTPWQAIGSIRYKLTDRLTLNGQAVRFGWKNFDQINLVINTPIGPSVSAIDESYRNTWSFAGGVDYDLSDRFTLRAGLQHDQTPTRDGARDARVPDADRWNAAAGASFGVTPGFTIDAAANYIWVKDAVINRPSPPVAGSVIVPSGRLDKANVVVLALGGRLAF
jgi:long-chain fatty acid transport protein